MPRSAARRNVAAVPHAHDVGHHQAHGARDVVAVEEQVLHLGIAPALQVHGEAVEELQGIAIGNGVALDHALQGHEDGPPSARRREARPAWSPRGSRGVPPGSRRRDRRSCVPGSRRRSGRRSAGTTRRGGAPRPGCRDRRGTPPGRSSWSPPGARPGTGRGPRRARGSYPCALPGATSSRISAAVAFAEFTTPGRRPRGGSRRPRIEARDASVAVVDPEERALGQERLEGEGGPVVGEELLLEVEGREDPSRHEVGPQARDVSLLEVVEDAVRIAGALDLPVDGGLAQVRDGART